MADPPQGPQQPEIPEAVARVSRRRWLQLVWIIPIVAALIGGWLAVKGILERGPTITITFKTAESLEAGKTRIKYKDVDIGVVRAIGLTDDRREVVVTADLSKQADSLLVEDTRFWVVRPRIVAGQVFGLGTLLSGAYIAMDPGKSTEKRESFVGLETPPIVTGDLPGRQFVLRSDDLGWLDIGSSVYFRGVQAGSVVAFEVDEDGKGVSLTIFVRAPYDQYVTSTTRFWNTSGVDVTLDANGLRIETQSLVSLVFGGIAFQTPADSPATLPIPPNTVFTLFHDSREAFKHVCTSTEIYALIFDQSVRGLAVGAPVDFRGVNIGEVTRVAVDFDPRKLEVRMPVEIRICPDQLRMRYRKQDAAPLTPAERIKLLERIIARGLRAQLRTANLLTGQLYVALDFFPDAPKATLNTANTPLEIPTVPGTFEGVQNSVANIVKKLEKIPFDKIAGDLRKAAASLDQALKSTDQLVRRLDTEVTPELRAILEQSRATLGMAQRTLDTDAPTQTELRATLQEVTRAAEGVRRLADYLERHPESLIRGKQEDKQ